MYPPTPTEARAAEITKIAENEEDSAALHLHLKEVMEGDAFKGSHRSAQFLKYVVEQAIAGRFDSLKERVIGVELFGRPPSYDTGDDAIVRVTASDVRRRLLQHYGMYGTSAEFHISLPLGSYIPEITKEAHSHMESSGNPETQPEAETAALSIKPKIDGTQILPTDPCSAPGETSLAVDSSKLRWLALILSLIAIAVFAASISIRSHLFQSGPTASSVLPWSAFFPSTRSIQMITSDPDIAEIQILTGDDISVSDYANHRYIPTPNELTPEVNYLFRTALRGDKSAAVDAPIVANIAALATTSGRKIDVHAARSIQLTDLKTEDNFIFLGSPRSNPWSALFKDQLDFQFVFDKQSGQEVVHNVHPQAHEPSSYIPTAMGWGTGESFAIIAFIQNLDQDGQVLLLAGANAEGTEAAGRLITDLPRLSATLQKCGLSSSKPQRHFELLVHLNTMAGSPEKSEVIACHILPSTHAH